MGIKRTAGILLIVGCVAACDSSTGPGVVLPVTLTVTSDPTSTPSATITSAADQVMGTVIRPSVCGYETGASAALDHASLTVTVSLISEGPVPCAAIQGPLVYRVTVNGVPSGTYDAALHFRQQLQSGTLDSTVATARVVIP